MKKIFSNSKYLLLLTFIVVVAALSFYFFHSNNINNDKPAEIDPVTGGEINYGPPTEQEKKETEDFKKSLIEDRGSSNNQTSGSIKTVTPIIVSYGQSGGNVEVSARVPGIFESGGTCTLIMTKDSQKVTKSKEATPNVSEVSCGYIAISRNKLSAGSWSAKVSYSSSKAKGVSEPRTVEVE